MNSNIDETQTPITPLQIKEVPVQLEEVPVQLKEVPVQLKEVPVQLEEIPSDNYIITTNNINNLVDIQKTSGIELSLETYNKLVNYLINELKGLKSSNDEKDLKIQSLTEKIVELNSQIEDLEGKLNKKDNLEILLKLKENLINKQKEISNEIEHQVIQETNYHDTTISKTNEINIQLEHKITNVKIEDDFISLKPKKKPSVLRRAF